MRDYEKKQLNSSFIDMKVIRTAQKKYDLTDEETFDMFIAPALDDAERNKKTFKFPFRPDLPIDNDGNFSREWLYLRDKYGYHSSHQESAGVWVLDKTK